MMNYVISVGAVLADDLRAMAITQKELAEKTGVAKSIINEIIKGKRKITVELAIKFEPIFGVPADYWINLQTQYELARHREKEMFLIDNKGTIKTGTFSAISVAHWLINRAAQDVEQNGEYLTHLKLQKMLYLVQERSIKTRGTAVFYEPILNWDLGPVVECVYHEYKSYVAQPLMEAPEEDFDAQTTRLLESVYVSTKNYTASGLVTLTHNRSDWQSTNRGEEITLEMIRDSFRNKLPDTD